MMAPASQFRCSVLSPISKSRNQIHLTHFPPKYVNHGGLSQCCSLGGNLGDGLAFFFFYQTKMHHIPSKEKKVLENGV